MGLVNNLLVSWKDMVVVISPLKLVLLLILLVVVVFIINCVVFCIPRVERTVCRVEINGLVIIWVAIIGLVIFGLIIEGIVVALVSTVAEEEMVVDSIRVSSPKVEKNNDVVSDNGSVVKMFFPGAIYFVVGFLAGILEVFFKGGTLSENSILFTADVIGDSGVLKSDVVGRIVRPTDDIEALAVGANIALGGAVVIMSNEIGNDSVFCGRMEKTELINTEGDVGGDVIPMFIPPVVGMSDAISFSSEWVVGLPLLRLPIVNSVVCAVEKSVNDFVAGVIIVAFASSGVSSASSIEGT